MKKYIFPGNEKYFSGKQNKYFRETKKIYIPGKRKIFFRETKKYLFFVWPQDASVDIRYLKKPIPMSVLEKPKNTEYRLKNTEKKRKSVFANTLF